MADRILVPLADTELSVETLEYALAEHPDAEFTVFHVLSASSRADRFVEEGVRREDVEAAAADIIDRARDVAAEHDTEVDVVETTGSPPQAIVEEAETGDYDLIVMGTHARQGAERMLAGSVTEEVIRNSPIPVLAYR